MLNKLMVSLSSVRNVVLVCVVLLSMNRAACQKSNSDSLKTAIDEHSVEDRKRVDLICDWIEANSLGLDDSYEPYLKNALIISKKLNYKEGEAQAYFLHGWYYKFKSQPKKAIEYNYQAIVLFKELGDVKQLLRTYANLANIYIEQDDLENALQLNLKTIELSEELPPSPEKASYYFYTAKTFGAKGDFEGAHIYITKAQEISEACDFQMGQEIAKGSLGHNFIMRKQYRNALPLLTEFLDFTVATNQSMNTAATYKSLGECYFELEQYESAVLNLSNGIEIYEEHEYKSHLEVMYNVLGDSYQKLGQLNRAIESFKKSAEIVNELKNEEQTKAIEELKTQYKTKELKQEKLLAESNEKVANEKEKRSRYTSYGLAIAAVLLVGLLFYIIRQLKIIRTQKTKLDVAYELLEESKKNELVVSNLKAIRSQMNPHLVFNSLNSIQALVLEQEVEKSYDYIEKFSSMFRKTLNYSELNTIDLDKEIEFLSIYLDLESLRMKEEFRFSITKSVNQDISIPTLLIQPFIENAIHHGLLHKEGDKKLMIEFKMEEGYAKCIIEDNGIGREMSQMIKTRQSGEESFSLSAIKKRLSLLGEQGGGQYDFIFDDLVDTDGHPAGTKVTICFPHSFNY